jgi:DNA polymerase-3 subunit epsilon
VNQISNQSRIDEVPLVFLDVETTGLSPASGDRVCEVGLLRREADGKITEFAQLIDPQRPVSPGALAVNGISAEMLEGAPLFDDVRPHIDAILAGAVWVAHNAPFDLGFLGTEYRLVAKPFDPAWVLDTAMLARRRFRFRSNRLGALAAEFAVATPDAHRALGDCRTTHDVFFHMIRRLFAERAPTVQELLEILSLAEQPPTAIEPVLPASLAAMLEETRDLQIRYIDADGTTSERSIHATRILQGVSGAILVAHCRLRGGERHFRLDRIVDWRPSTDEHRDEPD